jgi:two-component system sensor histidine kinase QseC
MPERAPSLHNRLLVLLLGALSLAWLGVAIATYLDARGHTGRMLDAQLVEYSEVLGAIASHEALEIAGTTTHHDPAYVQSCTYQVYGLDGSLLMRSHDAPNAALAAAEGFSDVRSTGVDWRAYRRTDPANGLVVIVAHGIAERERLVRDLALRLIVPLAIGLPTLAIALWLAATHALRPLDQLAGEVRRREAGHLAPIEARGVPAEVEPLVSATNQLFARLEQSFDNERRFTGDAAHELRTPLAALRTHAEVALTTAQDDRRRRALGQVVEGVERATRLVDQMLALARLDAAQPQPLAVQVDLRGICAEALQDARDAAAARGIVLRLESPAEVRTLGDRAMLRSLLRNLIENALRFAPDAGAVHVTVVAEESSALLAVEDSGPGVPAELRGRIFDRFFRGADGRGAGSGLGLSIVRRIAELHGGTVIALSSPALGGLRIEARFRLAP